MPRNRLAFSSTSRAMPRKITDLIEAAGRAHELLSQLAGDVVRSARLVEEPLPIDVESKLELVRRESVEELPHNPEWPAAVAEELSAIVYERVRERELLAAGLSPTK